MIKPEQIPDKVVMVARWETGDLVSDEGLRNAIAAAINAWPDKATGVMHWGQKYVSLMLPQEKNDD